MINFSDNKDNREYLCKKCEKIVSKYVLNKTKKYLIFLSLK